MSPRVVLPCGSHEAATLPVSQSWYVISTKPVASRLLDQALRAEILRRLEAGDDQPGANYTLTPATAAA